MITSDSRILTTHTGSLPRTERLAKLLIDRDNDLPIDDAHLRHEVEPATDWIVARQLDSDVDIGNDGEEARVGFQTYVSVRLFRMGRCIRAPRHDGHRQISEIRRDAVEASGASRGTHRQAVQLLPMSASRPLSAGSCRREDGASIVSGKP